MNYRNYFEKTAFLVIVGIFAAFSAFSQSANISAPREDKLLNGMKVLVWSDLKAEQVTVKLRIHAGSAFDPKDKEGVMALLADSIFPTDQTNAFFTEDLDGSLEVTNNYDYIQISVSGKSSEVLAMLETISNAIVNNQPTPENFKAIVEARKERVKNLEKSPTYLADQAVSKRLFGEFPYGRPTEGTSASLAKIDRADLLFARERFLTSDNATIAIVGNVKTDYAFRVTRQLFGNWVKSDKKVPLTFRQADEPNTAFLPINIETTERVEMRFASRGLARNDKDYWASEVFAKVLESKFAAALPEKFRSGVSIKNNAYILPGILKINISIPQNDFAAFSAELPKTGKIKESITESDFESAKSAIEADLLRFISDSKMLANLWLDLETYKTSSIAEQKMALAAVTFDDMNKIGERLLKDNIKVSIAVMQAEKKADTEKP